VSLLALNHLLELAKGISTTNLKAPISGCEVIMLIPTCKNMVWSELMAAG
jgi:hypothetical protein